ncbi:MAG: LysR family transcriptional regulator [Kofleriaceae bacterium]
MNASMTELEAVQTVARTKSFRGAAVELAVSPSALSQAVASLEARLGVRLFARSTRNVALTGEGEAFVRRLQPALREIDAAIADARETNSEPRGALKIAAPRVPAQLVLMGPIAQMRATYPAVSIELHTVERLVDLVSEGFDAGLYYAGLIPRDMIAVRAAREHRIAIVATPAYLAAHGTPKKPADLAQHECIRYRKPAGTVRRWDLQHKGAPVSVEVDGSLVVDDEALLLDAALAGCGIAYLRDVAADPHVAAKRLVRLLPSYAPSTPALELYYPSGRLVRSPLRAFAEIIRRCRV